MLLLLFFVFFFFKQKTAYEMRISDWSSDVCSSDLKTAQRIGLQIANIALYGDIAEFVTIALFHHIGDDEVPLVRRQFSNRGNDAKIGITLSEIELPQLLLVISQTDRKSTRLNSSHSCASSMPSSA